MHTPRYLLRRRIILHLLRRYPPGRFLEIGCGRGELMPWLARLGFDGVGLELSQDVLPLARDAVKAYEPRLAVVDRPEEIGGERFRYVFAFEVLEHIEDDAAALKEWGAWVQEGGMLILSVPAHMRKWTAADEVGGHFRRYERDGLRRLLESCGYRIDVFWNYGFPLTSVTSRLRGLVYRSRLRGLEGIDRQERTLRSSLESTQTVRRGAATLGFLVGGIAAGAHLLQLPFRGLDVGDGYLVACRMR